MARSRFSVACLAVAVTLGSFFAAAPRAMATTYYAPLTVDSTCSTDVTTQLQSWIDSVPNGSTLSFGRLSSAGIATPGCYLVSNSASALLKVIGRSNLVFAGNGSTLRQTTYPCGTNVIRPVLQMKRNTSLAVNNLVIEGPGTCGGAYNEGDYGLLVQDGNAHVAFDRVTVRGTDGDGLAVYPVLATRSGINTDITFRYGSLDNVGYHGVTLEGVNGFEFSGNTVNRVGNFMDLEVDNSCVPYSACFANGLPTGPAQWNVLVQANTFTNGKGGLWIESEQASCVPQAGLSFRDNHMPDGTVTPSMVMLGGRTDKHPECPHASGLQISGNTATRAATGGGCGGGITKPPGCGIFSVANTDDVVISGNDVRAYDGTATYYPNTLYIPGATICGAFGANSVTGNVFHNAWAVVLVDTDCWGWNGTEASTPVTHCGNTYGLTDPVNGAAANPQHDAVCE